VQNTPKMFRFGWQSCQIEHPNRMPAPVGPNMATIWRIGRKHGVHARNGVFHVKAGPQNRWVYVLETPQKPQKIGGRRRQNMSVSGAQNTGG
jgi:hypothetical protein